LMGKKKVNNGENARVEEKTKRGLVENSYSRKKRRPSGRRAYGGGRL